MNALLLYPEFSSFSFYNWKDVCKITGTKYPESPLGLITMAALLPEDWDIKLVDLNTTSLKDSQIDWADLVFIGGMLPQQKQFLELIDRVHSRGRKVVAGGADPTSQPAVYKEADYLVLGEAEIAIHGFLEDLEKGVQSGEYVASHRPDVTESPVPRFDLLNFKDYMIVGIQFCRGCPFNCEFCDIIELYGRKPRTKTVQQIIKELDTLNNLGYRGQIDFVDDNFIGHKAKVKEVLRAVKTWSEKHNYPFFYSTQASINIADDDELLGLMRDIDFRYIFIGIESADDSVLELTQKKQNVNRKLTSDFQKIYKHGMIILAGFIIGFDNETSGSARKIIDIIERGNICMSMVGLLFALPNTQLVRRLEKENRLLIDTTDAKDIKNADVDQASSGLNFVTKRPRAEIINDFLYVIDEVFLTKNYYDRVLRVGKLIETNYLFKPNLKKILQLASSCLKISVKLGLKKSTFFYYWRNIFVILFTKVSSLETVITLMTMHIHYSKHTKFVSGLLREQLILLNNN